MRHKGPEYAAFINARLRCADPNHHKWERYGGRGIKFLFVSFYEFMFELGPRPTPQHSLDRVNNDGNYESGNVRWATKEEQYQNKTNVNQFSKMVRRLGPAQDGPPIKSTKLCECGCGQHTTIAKRTDARRGNIKGQPTHFFAGHNFRKKFFAPNVAGKHTWTASGVASP